MTKQRTLDIDIPGLDKLFIAGDWVAGSGVDTWDVVMPSTEETIASVPLASIADADAAVAAAREAFDTGPWPRMAPAERASVCARFGEELVARLPDLNRAWTFESGFPLLHGETINGSAGRLIWERAIELAPDLPWEEIRETPTSKVLLERIPIGTVLAVLTYNGPVIQQGMKVIPGLLAGCPVIMKFAPDSQLTARLVAEAARISGFPAGVVSALPVDLETSRYLVEHKGIDMVHMTGGIPAAVEVVGRTSKRLARTALELGGKSPAIIMDDVDLDEVMSTLVPNSIGGLAQSCVALSRILAPRSRYDDIVSKLVEAFESISVGDPFDPSNDMGPLGNVRALGRVQNMLEGAIKQGAKIATGGRRPPHLEKGYFFEPTLLVDVDETMDIAQHEVFGPIIVVIPYDTVDDAVRIANGTEFGLAGSVYGGDEKTALDLARRVRSGSVAVNQAGVCLTEPFGGVKQSGWGREGGTEGILEFTEIKQYLLRGVELQARLE
ncbi:aldehyde dehydrogenase family protein [Sciscionella marina]|uniref:aldehyde dehydrogenase family protein n=1 Tax=Sciscionella marina TaxID=508770 RepID=UPI00037964EF|nr:aldehyde dehydrogenase family protein [Sciscionella marina]